jgi:hypothetical protein
MSHETTAIELVMFSFAATGAATMWMQNYTNQQVDHSLKKGDFLRSGGE